MVKNTDDPLRPEEQQSQIFLVYLFIKENQLC